MRLPLILAAALLALGAIEGIAWWWMNPAPAGLGEPVLAYRPGVRDQETGVRDQEETSASSSLQQSKINNHQSEIPPSSTDHRSPITDHSSSSANQQSKIKNHQSEIPPSSTTTLLPELYRQAAPMLRCTSGRVFHIALDEDNRASLHAAWFEWDDTDAGSVLEAFRHPPEACMGAIGMILVSKEKPIRYTVRVRDQESGDKGQESGVRSQEEGPAQSPSSTDHRPVRHSFSDAGSPITDHSSSSNLHLIFDHTIFREPGASANPLLPSPPVHAFRAVWVAGMPRADARKGIDGKSLDNLRTIRLRAALTRHRPSHARVIQAAVRGHHTTQDAWNAFEQNVLHHLTISASGESGVRGR